MALGPGWLALRPGSLALLGLGEYREFGKDGRFGRLCHGRTCGISPHRTKLCPLQGPLPKKPDLTTAQRCASDIPASIPNFSLSLFLITSSNIYPIIPNHQFVFESQVETAQARLSELESLNGSLEIESKKWKSEAESLKLKLGRAESENIVLTKKLGDAEAAGWRA